MVVFQGTLGAEPGAVAGKVVLLNPTTPTATPTSVCTVGWTVDPLPDLAPGDGWANGVLAISPNNVWVVGRTGSETLVEHWDGHRWGCYPSPNPYAWNEFTAVTAVAANDIWAVGYGSDESGSYTLTAHWDGSEWRYVPSPTPPSGSVQFRGIAAAAADDVWAVGEGGTILHWDGVQWSLMPSDLLGAEGFYSVAAISPNDVWAVGLGPPNGLEIVHWNGIEWSIVPNPAPPVFFGGDHPAIAAVAANDVWVVGNHSVFFEPPHRTGGWQRHSLVLHWTGGSWNTVSSPEIESLTGVAVVAANDVWIVPKFFGPPSQLYATEHTLLHWDGNWTQIPYPQNVPMLHPNAVAATVTDVWIISFDGLVGRYIRLCP